MAQDYNLERYEAKNGLPQNSVKAILQDKDGYLWLSTEGGLSKFDGVNFTNYNIDSDTIFKSNRFGLIFENKNGDLLFWNYGAGLFSKRGHQFINLSDSINAIDKRVKRILYCAKNTLFIQSYNLNVSFLNSETYQKIDTLHWERLDVLRDVHILDKFNFWVYRDSIEVRDHSLSRISTVPTYIPNQPFSAAFNDITSELWTLEDDSLCRFIGSQKVSAIHISMEEFGTKRSYLLAKNNALYIWLAGTSIVYSVDSETGNLSIYSDEQDICPAGRIYKTLIDQEGNVWFATSACGLIKAKSPRIRYLDKNEWNVRRNFYPIAKDSLENIYIGGSQSGIIKINGNGDLIAEPKFDQFKNITVNSIAFHKGAQYFSTYIANHIWKNSDNETFSKIYFPDSIKSQKNALYNSPSGKLLVGSHSGYYEMVQNELVDHPILGDEDIGFISNFHETKKGIIWVASRNQLLAYNPELDELTFDSRKSIPQMKGFREIVEDSTDRFFVGSYGYGLLVMESGVPTQITKDDGLIEDVISTITADRNGNIWLTGNKGLSRIRKAEILDFASGKRDRVNVVLYNEQTDRFRTSEFNGGHQQSKLKLADDCYVFPSMNGAVVVDFAKMQGTLMPPRILVEGINYNDTLYLGNQSFYANYSGTRLDIRYTSTSLISSNQIRFKYKLVGYDKDWIDAGIERKTSYSKIPPGEYTFQVMACSHEGVWNETPAKLSFTIVPPFYLTLWFRIALILLGIVLTALVVNAINRIKIKRIARRQKIQLKAIVETEEKERKRIAADLHDGVGQLLSRVKINLGLAEDEFDESEGSKSMELVVQSKQAVEEIMTELRNISYNLLPPSLDQFGLAVAIAEEVSKLKDNPNLHVHFDNATVDSKFDPKIEIVLFRVFQEILQNALKHADASDITIQLIQHETSLLLMIEDNGNGFEVQKAIRKIDSSGLKNIYSRVQFINGKMHIDSRPGNGANTTIEIPL